MASTSSSKEPVAPLTSILINNNLKPNTPASDSKQRRSTEHTLIDFHPSTPQQTNECKFDTPTSFSRRSSMSQALSAGSRDTIPTADVHPVERVPGDLKLLPDKKENFGPSRPEPHRRRSIDPRPRPYPMKRRRSSVYALQHQGLCIRHKIRHYVAEFLGTFVMVLLVIGGAAEETVRLPLIKGTPSWLLTSFSTGLAILFGLCIAGNISGGHLNPAVTITFWLFTGFPRKRVPFYILAQLLGAFAGAAVMYGIIFPTLNQFDGGKRAISGPTGTAGVFATYPPMTILDPSTMTLSNAALMSSIASEVLGTALLLLVTMVSGNPNNQPFCFSQAIYIAIAVVVLVMSMGYTSGFAINPARDLGPRFFTAIAGWGFDVFTVYRYYFFVPLLAPLLGAMLGRLVYTVLIDLNRDPPRIMS
ncbi:aquaporin [Hesseltinella vesiculosa]|uniref:Aquaporin n=1 Tax=Hesseltinella vesiculosa TaxID=101127 RepID=A0A1X2GJJ3_9FUNG|nr:aquaporin [Hesseltinella vesiculosa]